MIQYAADMADCEQKVFYAPGSVKGKGAKNPSCETPEVKIPEELKRQPKGELDFTPELVPDNIILYSSPITLACTAEKSYGDVVYVPQGYSQTTYQILTLDGISQDIINYIIKNNIISWLTNYINNEIGIATDSFDENINTYINTVAKKSNLTKKQSKQLLLESRDIILQLNISAEQFAESQLLCYWLSDAVYADCPAPEPGEKATIEYNRQQEDPTWHPVTVTAGQIKSYISQKDANAQALKLANSLLKCNYGNQQQEADCAADKNMPGIDSDDVPVYPGLKARVAHVVIAPDTFTSNISEADANAKAKEYAVSLLICFYVNKRTVGKCTDPTAGTLIEHKDENGNITQYSTEYRIANVETGDKGQYVEVPKGFITSDISQDDADFQAQQLAESLITCCFINQELIKECPIEEITDSEGDIAFVGADPDKSDPSIIRVRKGEFYSCVSQEDVDAQAEAAVSGQLNCIYCNIIIPPECVPDWVRTSALTGVEVPDDFVAPVDILLENGDIYRKGETVPAGANYQITLPLNIKTLVNPFTGQLEDTSLWSEDATVGSPAGYSCLSNIKEAQQLAELSGSELADESRRKTDQVCRYYNLKTIVSCAGGDPWDFCPTCGRSHPQDVHTSPAPNSPKKTYDQNIKQSVYWTQGIDLDTGETFIFGNAKENAPFDEDLSYPNCASYLTVAAGVFVSYNSSEEATAAAMAMALSSLQCIHSNPEIHLYCPRKSLESNDYKAYITDWHPMTSAALPSVCESRGVWPANGHSGIEKWENTTEDEDSAPLFTVEPKPAEPNFLDESDRQLTAAVIPDYNFVLEDFDIKMPMLAQTSSTDDIKYYRNCTVEPGYQVIINGVPVPNTGQCTDANGLFVDCDAFTIDGVPSQGASDPIVVEMENSNEISPEVYMYIAAAKTNASKYLTSAYMEGGFYKDDCWYVFNRQGPMPSYIGPSVPYYGVTPEEFAAPGSNVIRIWDVPNKNYQDSSEPSGRPWSAVVYEKNPVIVASRTITTINNGSNHTCWLMARDLGLSLLYCRWCAPPVGITTQYSACCSDEDALNYEPECSADGVYKLPSTIKTEYVVSNKALRFRLPDRVSIAVSQCMFMATSKAAAVAAQKAFIDSASGGGQLCLYGNAQVSIVQLCKPIFDDLNKKDPQPTTVPKGKTKDVFLSPYVEEVYVMKSGSIVSVKDVKKQEAKKNNTNTTTKVKAMTFASVPGATSLTAVAQEFKPTNVKEVRHSTKVILKVEADTVISTVSKLDATLKALALLSSLSEVDCPVINSRFAMTPCSKDCNTFNDISAIMYDSQGNPSKPIPGMMNVDEGIMISCKKHTYELDQIIKDMFKDMMPCMMTNLPFAVICRGGIVPPGGGIDYTNNSISADDISSVSASATTNENAGDNSANDGTSNDNPPEESSTSSMVIYPPTYETKQDDIVTIIPEGTFHVKCGKYKDREEFTLKVAATIIDIGYCQVWNAELTMRCENNTCGTKFKPKPWELVPGMSPVTVPAHTVAVANKPVAAVNGYFVVSKAWKTTDPGKLAKEGAEQLACGMLHCQVGNGQITVECNETSTVTKYADIVQNEKTTAANAYIYPAELYTKDEVNQLAVDATVSDFICHLTNKRTHALPCSTLCTNNGVTFDITQTLTNSNPAIVNSSTAETEQTVEFVNMNPSHSFLMERTLTWSFTAAKYYKAYVDVTSENGVVSNKTIVNSLWESNVKNVAVKLALQAQAMANRLILCMPDKHPLSGQVNIEDKAITGGPNSYAWVYLVYVTALAAKNVCAKDESKLEPSTLSEADLNL